MRPMYRYFTDLYNGLNLIFQTYANENFQIPTLKFLPTNVYGSLLRFATIKKVEDDDIAIIMCINATPAVIEHGAPFYIVVSGHPEWGISVDTVVSTEYDDPIFAVMVQEDLFNSDDMSMRLDMIYELFTKLLSFDRNIAYEPGAIVLNIGCKKDGEYIPSYDYIMNLITVFATYRLATEWWLLIQDNSIFKELLLKKGYSETMTDTLIRMLEDTSVNMDIEKFIEVGIVKLSQS